MRNLGGRGMGRKESCSAGSSRSRGPWPGGYDGSGHDSSVRKSQVDTPSSLDNWSVGRVPLTDSSLLTDNWVWGRLCQ